MKLTERIGQDITAAMKARDQAKLSPLRMAKAAFMNREVEKGRPLEDHEAEQVLASLIKQRRDSIEQFTKGGREDLVQRETAEIAVLEAYVPPPVDAAELERAVQEAIEETGASSTKDLGKVMKAAMGRLSGRTVDGRQVNELARTKLGG
jgi:uncharacterized protein